MPVRYATIYMKWPDEANEWRQKVDMWLPRTGRNGEWGVIANVYGGLFGDDKNVLKFDSGHGCSIM